MIYKSLFLSLIIDVDLHCFQVHVQIPTGRLITIGVSPDDTLEEVSYKIQMKEGIIPDQQLLLFKGIKLDMCDTVDDYNIQEGSTIFLTLRNRGG